MNSPAPEEVLLAVIDRFLREGTPIEISGLGCFEHDGERVVFRQESDPLVFLGYAEEDRSQVKRLFRDLKSAHINPWMDCETLLPGQNWPRAIEQTIEIADFFMGCFSTNSVSKRGYFQGELAFALDIAKRLPHDGVFLIPLRLDDCKMPRHILNTTHYIDLFPDWDGGVRKLAGALRRLHAAQSKPRR